MGGVLAIDHGTRISGFAVADRLRLVSAPLPPARLDGAGPEILAHIKKLAGERDVDTLLVGLPLDGNGKDTGRSRDVRRFAGRLAAALPHLRVLGWDEHLSTRAARELLVDEGLSKAKRQALRDSYSALVILRDWLNSGEPATHPIAPASPG